MTESLNNITGQDCRLTRRLPFCHTPPLEAIPLNRPRLLALTAATYLLVIAQAKAQTFNTIYNFQNGAGTGGLNVPTGLVVDTDGTVYAVAEYGGPGNNGGVIQLTPPSSPVGAWTETTIYNFTGGTADGLYPYGNLLIKNGVLYGTTLYGGVGQCGITNSVEVGCGTAFSLMTPASRGGAWTETILHKFGSRVGDGILPCCLVFSPTGEIYGTTTGGGVSRNSSGGHGPGTVFRLNPPSPGGAPWTESVLYEFTGSQFANTDGYVPVGPLTLANGAIFGSTTYGGSANGGTVYQLKPPTAGTGPWNETILYSFPVGHAVTSQPGSNIVVASNGEIYGTTIGGTDDGSDCDGGCGSIFELAPPAIPGGAWTETTLYNFTGPFSNDGMWPVSLFPGANGVLLGTTQYGGTPNSGTLFELTPPTVSGGAWTETVRYVFGTSAGAGLQPTAVPLHASGALYGVTQRGGTLGGGAVFQITP